MPVWLSIPLELALGFGLIVAACFFGDGVHVMLHAAARSKRPLLRAMGEMHEVHHRFLDEKLAFHEELYRGNLWKHRVPETVTQLFFSTFGLLFLPPLSVATAYVFFLIQLIAFIVARGKDTNHVSLARVPARIRPFFVGGVYHGLHHMFPDQYFGSFTTLFDRVFGTGCQIAGRTFVVTGASGAFGEPLCAMLEREGARVIPLKFGVDFTYEDYSGALERLARADVLVLCHGSKLDRAMEANCDSFVRLIELFRERTRGRQMFPEVWAVGSEIECHPAWGNKDLQIYLESKRAYARRARWYFRDEDFLYRHIVPSAFTSRMGKGLISGKTAAAIAMFFIRRGYRYVPVTYTGIALVNYLKFLFRIHATAPAEGRA